MNLQDLRNAVRGQLDFDEDDLPNATLDLFIRDAFQATMSLHGEWPFYATTWMVVVPAGQQSTQLPSSVNLISKVRVVPDGTPLEYVDFNYAQDHLPPSGSGRPCHWSVWGSNLYVYPATADDITVEATGWRKPTDWVSLGASAVPDCDERLVIPLIYYACSLVYAQQEDEVLEQMYQARYERAAQIAVRDVMRPSAHTPKRFAYGYKAGRRPLDLLSLGV